MTPFEEGVFERLVMTTQAWEQLHDPEIGGSLDADGLLSLMKAAGLSEDEAQKAASKRGLDRLRKGMPS